MEWVASALHTTSEHGVSSVTTADAHTSAANSRLNWRPRRFKWTPPFRPKMKTGFSACAITFQKHSTFILHSILLSLSSFIISPFPSNSKLSYSNTLNDVTNPSNCTVSVAKLSPEMLCENGKFPRTRCGNEDGLQPAWCAVSHKVFSVAVYDVIVSIFPFSY